MALRETIQQDAPLKSSGSHPAPRRTFFTLQAGRGIAAVMVLLVHTGGFAGGVPAWRSTIFQKLFYPGLYGVDFFFILSGFVMIVAHERDFDRPSQLPQYLWNRFRRIYPLYWFFLVPTILKQLFVNGEHTTEERNPFTILSSMVLFHIRSLNLNLSVSWTLFHEVLFYLFFAVLLVNKRAGIAICSLWLLASFAFFTPDAYVAEPHRYLSMIFSPLHLLFAAGALAGYMLRRGKGSNKLSFVILGFVVWVVFLSLHMRYAEQAPWLRILAGMGLTLGIVTLAQREATFHFSVPRSLILLGDASYSIYLSHFIVVWALARMCYRFNSWHHFPLTMYVLFIAATALAVGIAAHFLIERPLLILFGARKPGYSTYPVQ